MTGLLWDAFWGDDLARSSFNPALDVAEAENAYIVTMDVPGVKRDDMTIEMRDNLLTIRGHREANFEGSIDGLQRIERSYGTFERTLQMPRGAGEVHADLEDGVLKLKIAKPIEAQPKRIEIGSGSDDREEIEAAS